MSTESDVLMQQFRHAVYQSDRPRGGPDDFSPEVSIERRANLFREWKSSLIVDKEIEGLAPELARDWAVADVTALRDAPEDRRSVAASHIDENIAASPTYAQILSTINRPRLEREKVGAAADDKEVAQELTRNLRKLAAEGALELIEATKAGLSATFADDSQTSKFETAEARRMEKKAYQKLAAVPLDDARAAVAAGRAKIISDDHLRSAVRFDDQKFRAAVKAGAHRKNAATLDAHYGELDEDTNTPRVALSHDPLAHGDLVLAAALRTYRDSVQMREGVHVQWKKGQAYEEAGRQAFGSALPQFPPATWNGTVRVQPMVRSMDKIFGGPPVPVSGLGREPDMWSVFVQRSGDIDWLVETFNEKAPAYSLADRLQSIHEQAIGEPHTALARHVEQARFLPLPHDDEVIAAALHAYHACAASGETSGTRQAAAKQIALAGEAAFGASEEQIRSNLPADWNGSLRIDPMVMTDDNHRFVVDPADAVSWEIYLQLEDGRDYWLTSLTTDEAADALAKRLEAIYKRARALGEVKADVDVGLTTKTQQQATDYLAQIAVKASADAADAVAATTTSPGAKQESGNGFVAGAASDRVEPTQTAADPAEIISKFLENATYQTRPDGSVLYLINNRPAFVDHGRQILMAPKASDNEDAILAAVLLAKEKYGGAFEVTGSKDFKRRTIEILLRHKIDVTLKNPSQEVLRRELAKGRQAAGDRCTQVATDGTISVKPMIGKPAVDQHEPALTSVDHASNSVKNGPNCDGHTRLVSNVEQSPPSSGFTQVRALDWWSVQQAAIRFWAKSEDERNADLEQLGPAPADTLVYWLDRHGDQRDAPAGAASVAAGPAPTAKELDAAGFRPAAEQELRARGATEFGEISAKSALNVNLKEFDMAAALASNDQNPKLILRGVKKLNDGKFDTTILLFQGTGNYLQGYVKVGDQKHQVIAHVHERQPDQETGEVKQNYLKLSELYAVGDDTKWKEIGFGNAVNRRKDDKPVYFDEVLFSVGTEVIKARITKHVDADMHGHLGFEEPRKARPKDHSQDTSVEAKSPKPTAPAAKQKEDAAGAPEPAHSAQSMAAKGKSRTQSAAANGGVAGRSKASHMRPRG